MYFDFQKFVRHCGRPDQRGLRLYQGSNEIEDGDADGKSGGWLKSSWFEPRKPTEFGLQH